MPYYMNRKKKEGDCEENDKPKPRKPLRKTPLKRVSDKRMAEIREGRQKPVQSQKKAAKPRSRNRSTIIRELDRVFSEYIRLRDSKEFGYRYCRCISCGKIKPYEDFDAGHYYSRTKMSTRFSELNVNCECKYCNRFSADHLIGYRENLIKKIGKQKFDLLTIQANTTSHIHEFEMEALIKYYKALVTQMKEERDGTGRSRLVDNGFDNKS